MKKSTLAQSISFLSLHRYKFLLLGILFLGLFLRFYHLSATLWSEEGYDESRDMLVAQHLATLGEGITRGPFAAGGLNWLLNSPVYYYCLAALWFFARSPINFIELWAFLMSLTVLLAYKIGQKIWDRKTGLLLAFLCAIQSQLVYNSRELSQIDFLPIFSLLLIFALIRHLQKPSVLTLCSLILFLLLPLHFHYGVLILFPVGVSYVLYEWFQGVKRQRTYASVIIPFLVGAVLFFSWIFLTYRSLPFDQVFFFILNFQNKNSLSLHQIGRPIPIFLSTLWGNVPVWLSASLTGGFILLATQWPKHAANSKTDCLVARKLFALLLAFAASFLVAGFFRGYLSDSYLFSLLPFLLVFLAIGLRVLLNYNWLLGVVVIICVALVMGKATWNALPHDRSSNSFFEQDQVISKAIFTDYQKQTHIAGQLPSFTMAVLPTTDMLPFDAWGTTAFWFDLENLFHRPLVRITNFGVNVQPLVTQPQYFYLICDQRVKPDKAERECLKRFIGVRNYLVLPAVVVYRSPNFMVWRFGITEPRPTSYSFVYPDILK